MKSLHEEGIGCIILTGQECPMCKTQDCLQMTEMPMGQPSLLRSKGCELFSESAHREPAPSVQHKDIYESAIFCLEEQKTLFQPVPKDLFEDPEKNVKDILAEMHKKRRQLAIKEEAKKRVRRRMEGVSLK